jgi:hypothetical protein|tara:strand:+ start:384 stop:815 length:432 start_codon:yes stop_codon:yes gene_type:complete
MFFNRHKQLFILGIIVIVLSVLTLYFQQIKLEELQNELAKVELQNVRVGAGTSKGKLGTAIFGVIQNNGENTIKIATVNVHFIGEDGKSSKVHKFYPVNNYSFSDSLPLEPGQSKEFGFPIDEIIPEDWDGTITAKLIDLKFK